MPEPLKNNRSGTAPSYSTAGDRDLRAGGIRDLCRERHKEKRTSAAGGTGGDPVGGPTAEAAMSHARYSRYEIDRVAIVNNSIRMQEAFTKTNSRPLQVGRWITGKPTAKKNAVSLRGEAQMGSF